MADVIITGDIFPDARPLILQIERGGCNAKVVVELTTRFDWNVRDLDDFAKYIKVIVERKYDNLYWVINNPWEDVYLNWRTKANLKARLIRPVGASQVIPENKGNIDKAAVVHLDSKIEKLFHEFDIPHIRTGNQYGGPRGLKRYKAFVEIPYQVSTMKFYENIAEGVIQLFPSAEFFEALVKNDTHGFSPWGNGLGSTANWTNYMEYYNPIFKPYVYYFDSWEELATILREKTVDEIDVKNVRVNGPLFYKKIQQKTLESWAELFRDMGYEVDSI
ncbi:hypothetical protein HDU76_007999 [Blyttiomyces sp. JEL0837]|nr:hypothetical protein HDU76_007999 [Blyttiomyces sp. JEL0837]